LQLGRRPRAFLERLVAFLPHGYRMREATLLAQAVYVIPTSTHKAYQIPTIFGLNSLYLGE
ncbi:hypothetical protein KI387_021448, partial [Taxus chinensis]